MNQRLSITLFAFLLCTLNIAAQAITGKVADQQQQPIEYANIMIGDTYGVMSNTEGVFTVNTEGLAPTDKVIISCIGFESVQLPLSELKEGTYNLKEKINVLDEVFITNKKLSATEILTEVIKNAPKNYAQKTVKETYFLRSSNSYKLLDSQFELLKSSLDSKATLKEINKEFAEMSKKTKGKTSKDFSEYYGFLYEQNNLKKLAVEKAIQLKNNEKDVSGEQMSGKAIELIKKYLDPGATYKVRSGIIPIDDSLKINSPKKDVKTDIKTASLRNSITALSSSLNKFYTNEELDFFTEFKKYTYTLEGYTTMNDETIYIIDFKPLKKSANYYGKIYVNAFDFGVAKLEYNLVEGKTESSVSLKFLLGVKMVEDRTKVSATYTKSEDGKYALNFVKKESGTYAYMNRSLKFTKNKADKNEETKMIKLDFLGEFDNMNIKELFIIDRKPISDDEFKNVTENTTYNLNYISKYDPSVWKDYNVLAPVEAIKNYN